jgi:transcriptional regulator with XRE-family HTH domain
MYLNLKVSIWQSGLRQNRLAQTLNMDEALLSRIINGFREPTAEQRSRIAQALQKDEGWLFAQESAHHSANADHGGTDRAGVMVGASAAVPVPATEA